MEFGNLKSDKGVAGLTILLSLVTMLFTIGLLVFIFALMGGELGDSGTLESSETATAVQSNVAFTDAGTTLTTCNSNPNSALTSIIVNNASVILNSANYTTSGCTLTAVGTSDWNGTTISNVTYTFTHSGSAWVVINDSTASISSVTDWYDIFIVITAMVVLILLTVIIISAIRGSGLMMGDSKSGGNVGTA